MVKIGDQTGMSYVNRDWRNLMDKSLEIAARILMSQIFIISGIQKIFQYSGTQAYMASAGLPGALLPLVILAEIVLGVAVLIGYQARWAAALLALYTIVSALFFHMNWSDPGQLINFQKNLAIAGGFLLFVKYGASEPSCDARHPK
jgi:putative oxidoreductase